MPRKTSTRVRQHHRVDRTLRVKVWNMRIFWQWALRWGYRGTVLVIVAGALGALAWGGKLAADKLFFNNPEYRLQSIRLNPNNAINERDLVGVTGLDLNDNIFRIDLRAMAKRLESYPPILSATCERQTPGTLVVTVTTRQPRVWLACPDAGLPVARKPGGLLLGEDGTAYACPQLQWEIAKDLPVVVLSKQPDAALKSGVTASHPELADCLRLIHTARDQGGRGLAWIDTVRRANEWSLALVTRDGVSATFGLGDHARQLADLHAAQNHAAGKGYGIATINLIPRVNVPVTVSTSAPPRAVPVDEEAPARPAAPVRTRDSRRARDLDSLIHRN